MTKRIFNMQMNLKEELFLSCFDYIKTKPTLNNLYDHIKNECYRIFINPSDILFFLIIVITFWEFNRNTIFFKDS